MSATETSRVVYTGTHGWWEIVSRDGEIEIDDGNWDANAERAAGIAGVNPDYSDSWVCQITAVADRHAAIRVGDYACCDGYGDDVIFVRLARG